jgi:hypothetical protein
MVHIKSALKNAGTSLMGGKWDYCHMSACQLLSNLQSLLSQCITCLHCACKNAQLQRVRQILLFVEKFDQKSLTKDENEAMEVGLEVMQCHFQIPNFFLESLP